MSLTDMSLPGELEWLRYSNYFRLEYRAFAQDVDRMAEALCRQFPALLPAPAPARERVPGHW